MTDATGTVQNNYSYGAWGEIRAQNTTVANSYGYTGREFSEEGLYFYRARYLDPGLGRFISEDLFISVNDSSINEKYSYVGNSPIEYSDALGLYKLLTETCKSPNYNSSKLQDAIKTHCQNVAVNHECQDKAKRLGGKKTLNCLKRHCIEGHFVLVRCAECEEMQCGRSDGEGIKITKKGLNEAGICGSLNDTFTHEAMHWCYTFKDKGMNRAPKEVQRVIDACSKH